MANLYSTAATVECLSAMPGLLYILKVCSVDTLNRQMHVPGQHRRSGRRRGTEMPDRCTRTCEGLEDDKTKSKRLDFGRELAAQILGRHIHKRAHNVLRLEMCSSDSSSALSVVFDALDNAKVANATNTAVIQKHIGTFDVTVDHSHFRRQVCQTTCNIREDQYSLLGRQRQANLAHHV